MALLWQLGCEQGKAAKLLELGLKCIPHPEPSPGDAELLQFHG